MLGPELGIRAGRVQKNAVGSAVKVTIPVILIDENVAGANPEFRGSFRYITERSRGQRPISLHRMGGPGDAMGFMIEKA